MGTNMQIKKESVLVKCYQRTLIETRMCVKAQDRGQNTHVVGLDEPTKYVRGWMKYDKRNKYG